jgi:hypothetical protein
MAKWLGSEPLALVAMTDACVVALAFKDEATDRSNAAGDRVTQCMELAEEATKATKATCRVFERTYASGVVLGCVETLCGDAYHLVKGAAWIVCVEDKALGATCHSHGGGTKNASKLDALFDLERASHVIADTLADLVALTQQLTTTVATEAAIEAVLSIGTSLNKYLNAAIALVGKNVVLGVCEESLLVMTGVGHFVGLMDKTLKEMMVELVKI